MRGLFSQEAHNTQGSLSSRGATYGFKIDIAGANKSRQEIIEKQMEEEEDDDFLNESTEAWDVFRDAHKFQKREEILKKRKKQKIEEEMDQLRSDRENKEDQTEQEQLQRKIDYLHEKIIKKDDVIDKKIAREQELLKEQEKKDVEMNKLNQQIQKMNNEMYHFEVLQEKFAQKEIEIQNLLGRMGELG